jgi:hypothetical protein
MSENRLSDYLDHIHQAAVDALSFVQEPKEQLGIVSTVPVTDPDEANNRWLSGNLPE